MTRSSLFVVVALVIAPLAARAQDQASPSCPNKLFGLTATNIAFIPCAESAEIQKKLAQLPLGTEVVIEAEGRKIAARVEHIGAVAVPVPELRLSIPAAAEENMLLLASVNEAKVTLAGIDLQHLAVVDHPDAGKNYARYEWSIGPATKGEDDDDSADDAASSTAVAAESTDNSSDDEPGALRFQFDGDYASGGLFGARKMVSTENPASPSEKRPSLWQTTASLSIDTTDQSSSDFIDNNQLTLGVGLTNLSLGRLWMHGTAGIEGHVEKAFHNDTQNVDALVGVSGWVPPLRSLTLFSKTDFIAAPLKFKASYGYRNHDGDDQSTNGRVLTANAIYNLYLFDNYHVSFDATWTHNDLDVQPANVPRTQRLYKATIAYLQPDSTFKVLTSIEDGSAGVMLREVRQYFVGIALSRLNLAGSGGS